MNRKHGLSVLLLLALAAFTYWTVFRKNDLGDVVNAIQNMDPAYLAGGAAVALFFAAAEGFMLWYLLRPISPQANLVRCIKYAFIGFFFSGITPSASGGQPAQLYYMKRDQIPLFDSSVALMSVAASYKFVLVVMGIGILIFWNEGLRIHLGPYFELYLLGLVLNGALVAVLLWVMLAPRLLEHVICVVERWLVKLRILKRDESRQERIQAFVQGYKDTVHFLRHNKLRILAVLLATILQRCSVFFLTWLIYQGFHLQGESALSIMMLQASIYIAVDMLPFPGSQGITELMYTETFSGIFTGDLLAASMCVTRGLNFYMLLIVSGGITVWNMICLRRKRVRDQKLNSAG